MRQLILWTGTMLVLAILWGAGPAGAETISKDYDETFPVKPGMRLVLEHGDGDAVILPWDRDEVQITVKYRAEVSRIGLGSEAKFEVKFTETPNEVKVIGRQSGFGGVGIFISDVRVYSYSVTAPAYLELETIGDDGDLQVSGWTGRLDLQVDDGDIRLDGIRADRTLIAIEDGELRLSDVQGDLYVRGADGNIVVADCQSADARFRLDDGDISLRDSSGRFEIEVADGHVDLLDVAAERLRVETADGDVTAALLQVGGMDVEITSGDGHLRVRLPKTISTKFTVRTGDGRISLDIPDAPELDEGGHHASGTLGDGDGNLRLSTGDGPVTLSVR